MYLLLRYHSSVNTETTYIADNVLSTDQIYNLIIQKSVVSVNLRSQPWNAMVSMHKIAQWLLNIVTFSHSQPRCSIANQLQSKL